MLLPLDTADIHVWELNTDEVPPGLIETSLATLSAHERNKANRFHFDRDRHLYLSAHLLLRAVLSKYAPVSADQWEFHTRPGGRPYISGPSTDRPLYFSLSHTPSWAVVAVAPFELVGTDVECLRERDGIVDTVLKNLSHREAETVVAGNASHSVELAFRFWTLKEAFGKAIGKGITYPMCQVEFDSPGNETGSVVIDSAAEIDHSRENWQFQSLIFADTAALAVVAQSEDAITVSHFPTTLAEILR